MPETPEFTPPNGHLLPSAHEHVPGRDELLAARTGELGAAKYMLACTAAETQIWLRRPKEVKATEQALDEYCASFQAYMTTYLTDHPSRLSNDYRPVANHVKAAVANVYTTTQLIVAERSWPRRQFERARVTRLGQNAGQIGLIGSGVVATKLANEAPDADTLAVLGFGAYAYIVAKPVISSTVRWAGQRLFGKKWDQMLRPVPKEIKEEVNKARTADGKKLSVEEKIVLTKELETEGKMHGLRPEILGEIGTHVLAKPEAERPGPVEIAELITDIVKPHLCSILGLNRANARKDDPDSITEESGFTIN